MSRLCSLMCALVIAVGWSTAWGQAPAARGGQGAGAGRGGAAAMPLNRAFFASEFDTMNQQLILTDEQKTKVREKVDAMNKEIDAFLSNAPVQIAAARRGARAGGPGGRGAARGPAATTPNPAIKLQDDLQLLINEHQVLINQVLTPDQRIQWEIYKLDRVIQPRIQNLSLTDDQRDKVKSLVDATAKSLAALTDGKSVQALQGQLFRKLIADILTDAQLGKLLEGSIPVQGAAGRGGRAGAAVPAEISPSATMRNGGLP